MQGMGLIHQCSPGINHKGVLKLRSPDFKITVVVEMIAEVFIQFPESLVVFGNAHILLLRPIPEVNAQHRTNAVLRSHAHKIQATGSVVDVGEGNDGKPLLTKKLKQLLRGEDAVAQRVMGVGVDQF